MKNKLFIRNCKYCGKKFYALYEKQVTNNHAIHEMNCPKKSKSNKVKPNDA